MDYFKDTKTQIAPCIASKARFALGIAHNEPSNNKTCSYNYWSKVIESLASEKSISSEVAKEAKEKFSHLMRKK